MRKIGWAWGLILGLGLAAGAAATPGSVRLISRQAKRFATQTDWPANSPQPQVDKAANRISYPMMNDIHLTAQAGPEGKMMSYLIDGLTNPEIRIPHGAQMTLNVVNVDDDMDHDLVITSQPPPYAAELNAGGVGTPLLKPHTAGPYAGAVLIFQAGKAGQLYYVCTVRGHAHAGMYGKLTITP